MRRQRSRLISLSALTVVVSCLAVAEAGPGWSHTAIRVEILAPRPGETVARESEIRVFARPMLFGVSKVRVRLSVDGRPVGPQTGSSAARGLVVIRAGQTLRFPLRRLAPGRHVVTVTYRPDDHAPPRKESVRFAVRAEGPPIGVVAASIAAGSLVLLGAGVVVFRRRSPGRTDGEERASRRLPGPGNDNRN